MNRYSFIYLSVKLTIQTGDIFNYNTLLYIISLHSRKQMPNEMKRFC